MEGALWQQLSPLVENCHGSDLGRLWCKPWTVCIDHDDYSCERHFSANIDNGYGAAYLAAQINRLAVRSKKTAEDSGL